MPAEGSAGAPSVLLEDVYYRYPGSGWVLRGVSAEIRGRGLVVVAGATGSGKSTLLRVIAGHASLYGGVLRGRVDVRGRVVFVPQNYDLFIVLLRVWEELLLAASAGGRGPGDARLVAERLGLGGLLGRRVSGLSAGERQRVALASALLLGPDMLLLDEPLAHLDPAAARRFLGLVREVFDGLLVVAEHRLWVFEGVADRFIALRGGRIVYDGGNAWEAARAMGTESGWVASCG